MDFGELLSVAKKNSENVKNTEQSKYYSTKFSAPRKETKDKKLSDNIKKFLAKKEQEEKEKERLAKEKLNKLLAMRDEKSKNKIRKMLKVTKSANKSVLDDAVDNENTAVTLQGPNQPDEDDYGYVSQEAAAFYQKYMDKVKALPEEDKFVRSKSTSKSDLSGTKDRVKEAIRKEQEEKNNPHRTKSKSSLSSSSSLSSKKDLYEPEIEQVKEEKKPAAQPKRPPPPPLDFKELLRLAEKKQYEPLEIEVPIEKEPERLLTKKQKRELEERKAYLEERERKEKLSKNNGEYNNIRKSSTSNEKIASKTNLQNQLRKESPNITTSSMTSKNEMKKPVATLTSKTKISSELKNYNNNNIEAEKTKNFSKASSNSNSSKIKINKNNSETVNDPVSLKSSLSLNSNVTKHAKAFATTSQKSTLTSTATKPLSSNSSIQQQKQILHKSSLTDKKQMPITKNHKEISMKSKSSTPLLSNKESVPKYSTSSGVQNNKSSYVHNKSSIIKRPMKRRIIDDDEDEYDSELDDFIDDGPEDESQTYSNYIKEIFGYDKSRYRDVDDDDPNMESSFVQQMKEEQFSKKIGILEDLEDMRQEAEEKRKKTLMKKKKLKLKE